LHFIWRSDERHVRPLGVGEVCREELFLGSVEYKWALYSKGLAFVWAETPLFIFGRVDLTRPPDNLQSGEVSAPTNVQNAPLLNLQSYRLLI